MGDTIQTLIPQVQETLEKLTLDLDALQTTVVRANDLLNDTNRSNLGQALARANDLMNDGNRARISRNRSATSIRCSATSRPKVSASLANINDATARLVPLLDDVRKTSARADQMLSNLDSALTENRPDLRISVNELRQVLANSTTTVDQLQNMMNQNSANIYEILENMRLSAANIRSLTETIKSRPSSLIRGVNVERPEARRAAKVKTVCLIATISIVLLSGCASSRPVKYYRIEIPAPAASPAARYGLGRGPSSRAYRFPADHARRPDSLSGRRS